MADLLSKLFSRQSDLTQKSGDKPTALRAGQVLKGTVVGQPDQGALAVRAAGRNLVVPSNLRLPAGSAVEVTVKQVEPQLDLSLAPAARPAQGPPAMMAGQSLYPGRTITATVLGQTAGGLTEVSMLGERFTAEAKVPLTAGQSVKLVVAETHPQVVLAVADEGGAAGAARLPAFLQGVFQGNQALPANLRLLLEFNLARAAVPEPVRQAAVRLQEAVRDFTAENPDPLRNAIKAAGLNLEAQLAGSEASAERLRAAARGLRPLVMALERAMAAEIGRAAAGAERLGGFEVFARAAAQVGSFFDNLTGLNTELAPRDSQLLLAVALALDDELESGELLVGLPEKDEEGGGSRVSLAFFLRLSALGPVAIEARVSGKKLWADFTVDSQDKARFINERLAGLTERFGDLGYEAHFTARVRSARQVEEASPLAELIRRQGQYFSVTV